MVIKTLRRDADREAWGKLWSCADLRDAIDEVQNGLLDDALLVQSDILICLRRDMLQ